LCGACERFCPTLVKIMVNNIFQTQGIKYCGIRRYSHRQFSHVQIYDRVSDLEAQIWLVSGRSYTLEREKV
jgi:hypothetical protein